MLKKKDNLLLAIGTQNIFHYIITSDNTNSDIFLSFLQEVINKIRKERNNKYILIMDNLSCHKNDNIIQFLVEEKQNVIFTPHIVLYLMQLSFHYFII